MAGDQNLRTVQKLLGVALIFMGFLNTLLSISGGYPLDQFSALTFLIGVILFVHGSAQTWRKWIFIGMALSLGTVFMIRGEVDRLSQLALFWGTILVIIFFIFFAKESKSNEDTTRKGAGTGN